MNDRILLYRWKMPGGYFGAWRKWAKYPSQKVRDEMLATRRAKYSWTDRFEFRAADAA